MEELEEFEDRLGMTEEQWGKFQRYTQGYGEQCESGVDISLIRANLRLTPTERMEKHLRAITAVQEVRRAGRALRSAKGS
jgi:hypothetical protein